MSSLYIISALCEKQAFFGLLTAGDPYVITCFPPLYSFIIMVFGAKMV
jgi:hypothetical protein